MKIIKSILLILVLFFIVLSYFYLHKETKTDYYSNLDFTKEYTLNIDTNNANININTSDKDQMQVSYETTRLKNTVAPIYYVLDGKTLNIKQASTSLNKNVDDTAEIHIYIPSDLKISNVKANITNSVISVDSISAKDLTVNGNKTNIQVKNSNINTFNAKGYDFNTVVNNSTFNDFNFNTTHATLDLNNSIISSLSEIHIDKYGELQLNDVSAKNMKVTGRVIPSLTLNVTKNYYINTGVDINNSNLTKTSTGYEYNNNEEELFISTYDFTQNNNNQIKVDLK